MTRFLFTTLPTDDLGLLARSLPIANELTARGHAVTFCSPAPAPRRVIAEAGFANLIPRHPIFDLIASDPSTRGLIALVVSGRWRQRYGSLRAFLGALLPALPRRAAPPTADVWNMDHAGALMGLMSEGFVRASCEGLREAMVESGAEVVVDFWNPMAVIAARSLGLPVVTVIQGDAHPASAGFIWWRPRPANIPTPAPVVSRVLEGYGLPPVARLADLSVGDLTLVTGMPATDPLPAAADVTYVGALLWQRAEATLPEHIEALSRDRPLVWVYSGNPRYASSGDALDSMVVLHACVAALRDEAVNVVLTTGHHRLPEEIGSLPGNFHFEPYLPGLVMAERSDLLVHHGGYGSCQTGLVAGRPAAIVPTYAERESNARRIAALGAGLVVPVERVAGKKQVRAGDLRAAVRRALADPGYAERARRAGDELRRYGGAGYAADCIERLRQVRIMSAA